MAQAGTNLEQAAPESIEGEMDLTRNRLADTIDQLVHRTSPKTIANREVASFKAHFVDAHGQPRTDNLLKVAGGVVGFVVLVVVLRRVTR